MPHVRRWAWGGKGFGMERYEGYSYMDLGDLQSAFDLISMTLARMRDNGGSETRDYKDLLEALFHVGNSICYGEEEYWELCS